VSGRLIPRTMASQHPDNACLPEWCKNEVIAGDDEVFEVYFDYAVLGCQEAMWDAEGKDIDPHVVRKLFTNHRDFFSEKRLGTDVFLTLRLPNPSIEVAEKKVFIETLESIPRHNDIARAMYGEDFGGALFEVILPFTTAPEDLLRVKEIYRKVVVEPTCKYIESSGHLLREFVGDVTPPDLEVIPLFEDMKTLINCGEIMRRYVEKARPSYLRVFIARSDPALNYGFITSVLLAKLALSEAEKASIDLGVPIHPIIGAGSLPFRGHNSPRNIDGFVEEYRGIWTATIQSAFRYDYPIDEARQAIACLNATLPRGRARILEEWEKTQLRQIIMKLSSTYQKMVEKCMDAVNRVVELVPPRRSRKLHIGLFGYSRMVSGRAAPRAIPFVAALYSLGLPPEFIGLKAIRDMDGDSSDLLMKTFVRLREDLREAGRHVVWDAVSILSEYKEEFSKILGREFLSEFLPSYLEDLSVAQEVLGVKVGENSLYYRRYTNAIENFLIYMIENDAANARSELVRAAAMRRSLG